MPPELNEDSVLSWRVREMESRLKELQQALDKAVGTFGSGVTSLQTQLTSYQQNISDKYVLRRDLDQVNERIDVMANRGWVLGLALLASVTSIVVAVISWFRPH